MAYLLDRKHKPCPLVSQVYKPRLGGWHFAGSSGGFGIGGILLILLIVYLFVGRGRF